LIYERLACLKHFIFIFIMNYGPFFAHARNGYIPLFFLLFSLYVPILILGIPSQWPLFQLALLGALSIFAMTFAPFITAAALKAVMDE